MSGPDKSGIDESVADLLVAAREWGDMVNGDIEAKYHDVLRVDLCKAAVEFNDRTPDHAAFLLSTPTREAAEEMREALKTGSNNGENPYIFAQIATFLGGMMDAYGVKNDAKRIGEEYVTILHALSDAARAALSKAEPHE